MMRQLFPIEHTIGGELLGVQVSFFDCGGIAIGVYLSHKVADPPSLCTFVLSWASIAKSGSSALKPIFDVASVFPPINDLPPCSGDETEIVVPDGRVIVDKVFRFEASKIATLKAKAKKAKVDEEDPTKMMAAKAKKAKVDEEDPTKMMAVAAFLWTIFSAMHGGGKKGNDNNNNTKNNNNSSSSPRHCMISVPVYVRGKVASLEEHTMGNAAATPLTKPMAPPIDLSAMPELVEAMRDAVRRVDEGGLVKRRDGGELVKMMEAYIEASNKAYDSEGELGLYEASSWEFPFYDADFGWGRPGWVVVNGAYANVVVCLDTKSGDGIDATVTLSEQDTAEFESMPELLKFATPVHNALD
ncbi:hypothetical protein Syun_020318 [Stephania yunnanensis]|uniref:BAHD acyltransferase n=1 Tax=Stephania yunnanensis TaxID=152371 RepID=A0AAP0IEW8_9MAGN